MRRRCSRARPASRRFPWRAGQVRSLRARPAPPGAGLRAGRRMPGARPCSRHQPDTECPRCALCSLIVPVVSQTPAGAAWLPRLPQRSAGATFGSLSVRPIRGADSKGAVLALVVLALWVVTAAAGVALLSSGNAARRRMAPSAQLASTPARSGAVPLTADGKPPPVPRTRVAAPAGEHPLLEFSHPALALSGLAFWFVFVLIHYRPLAWISLGILVVTLSAGLSWLARQCAGRPAPAESGPALPAPADHAARPGRCRRAHPHGAHRAIRESRLSRRCPMIWTHSSPPCPPAM